MLVGVIADTHDNVEAIERAVDEFRDRSVDVIVHCGDYIAPPVLPLFEGFEVHGVLGNNDGEREGLSTGFDQLGSASQLHGRDAELEFDGKSFYVLHGDQGRDVVRDRAETGAYDYVLYGHFHERHVEDVPPTTLINPGAHFPMVPADHRTVCMIDTESDAVSFHAIHPEPSG